MVRLRALPHLGTRERPAGDVSIRRATPSLVERPFLFHIMRARACASEPPGRRQRGQMDGARLGCGGRGGEPGGGSGDVIPPCKAGLKGSTMRNRHPPSLNNASSSLAILEAVMRGEKAGRRRSTPPLSTPTRGTSSGETPPSPPASRVTNTALLSSPPGWKEAASSTPLSFASKASQSEQPARKLTPPASSPHARAPALVKSTSVCDVSACAVHATALSRERSCARPVLRRDDKRSSSDM